MAAICAVGVAFTGTTATVSKRTASALCLLAHSTEVSFLHLVTSAWFLCCKALTGKGDLNCHGRAGVRAAPHHGLPGPMAADEHIQSKAHNLRLPVAPPKLSLRQPVHNGTFFHSTLCTHDCSPPHLQNVTTVTCVECGFVSHFIGGKIGIATFFILNRAFWKQVAIEHTPTLSPGVGTVGFM